MKYYLNFLAIGHDKRLEISESKYKEIESSNENLLLFNDFTLIYRITLDAYRRMEVSQYELALDHILLGFSPYSVYEDTLDSRVVLNSALIGYLAAARLFHDWADKHLSTMIGKEAFKNFDKFKSKIYDNTPKYKFVEELRNYVQHRGVPKHITYHNFLDDAENPQTSEIGTTMSFYAIKDRLQSDSNFKKHVLKDMPDKINVIKCIRVHMSGIWTLHDSVISNNSDKADEARKVIEKHRDRYQREVGGSLTGLYAVAEKAGTTSSKTPLFLNWDDARRKVLRKLDSVNLKNLSKQYITSKIQG